MSVVPAVAVPTLLLEIHQQIKAELAGLEPGKTTKEAEMMLLQKYGVILPLYTPEELEYINDK